MSNGFIYVVDAHFIDKIEENKYPGPKCLCVRKETIHKLRDNVTDKVTGPYNQTSLKRYFDESDKLDNSGRR